MKYSQTLEYLVLRKEFNTMKFGTLEELWYEWLHFLDRVMGWLNYVIGNAEDPYGYDGFWEDVFGKPQK